MSIPFFNTTAMEAYQLQLNKTQSVVARNFMELGFIFFVILYLYYWLRNLLRGFTGSEAYYEIPFEKEAYQNDENENYLTERKRFAWRGL